MDRIELSTTQHEQMAGLISQLSTTRQIAEAFVGYFAKELGVNLQVYQFNADNLAFEPLQGFMPPPPPNLSEQVEEPAPNSPAASTAAQAAAEKSQNGRIEAI